MTSTGWSGALVAIGILSVVLGVLVLVWPKATLLVVAILFGLQLIVAGAVRIAVTRELPSRARFAQAALDHPRRALDHRGRHLPLPAQRLAPRHRDLIAIGWIAEGIAALAQGFGSDRTTGARAFLIITGVLSILAGIIVAVWPGATLVVLTRLAGIMLIVIGIAGTVTAFVARRSLKAHGNDGRRPRRA